MVFRCFFPKHYALNQPICMRLYKHGTYLIHNCIVLVLLEEITDKIIKQETSARRPILRIYTAQYNHCNCLEQLLKAYINHLYINYYILNIARACVSQMIVEEQGDRAVGEGGGGGLIIQLLYYFVLLQPQWFPGCLCFSIAKQYAMLPMF